MGYAIARAVTPSDATVVGCQAFICGGGDVSVVCRAGEAPVTFAGLIAGRTYEIAAHQIRATNTTATGIVALYA